MVKPVTSSAPYVPDHPRTVEIVRREVISTMVLDDTGRGPNALTVGFQIAAGYLAENDAPTGVALEFVLFGRTFRAILDPDTTVAQNAEDALGNPWDAPAR